MSAFTPEQEARICEIVAEMIGQFAAGSDKRIREAVREERTAEAPRRRAQLDAARAKIAAERAVAAIEGLSRHSRSENPR